MEENDFYMLRAEVLETLPERSLALLKRLEAHACRYIRFAPHRAPPVPGDPNPDAPVCEITAGGATIRLRLGAPILAQGVTHELLHIERWWLEGVPHLYPAHPALKHICEGLENALEHLVIVPREARYGFEPYGHWNETYREIWSRSPLTPAMPLDVRRYTCLLAWLATSHVTDESVNARIEEHVRMEGLFDEAEAFKREIKAQLTSKPELVSYVARVLRIPEGAVFLRYYNASAGTVRDEPLPSG
jgi:hypothetical protein